MLLSGAVCSCHVHVHVIYVCDDGVGVGGCKAGTWRVHRVVAACRFDIRVDLLDVLLRVAQLIPQFLQTGSCKRRRQALDMDMLVRGDARSYTASQRPSGRLPWDCKLVCMHTSNCALYFSIRLSKSARVSRTPFSPSSVLFREIALGSSWHGMCTCHESFTPPELGSTVHPTHVVQNS